MRFGITIQPALLLWESGWNQTALQLGELFHHLGHDIYYLHSGLHSWWPSYPLPSYAKEVTYDDITCLDLLVDMDGALHSQIRRKIAKKTVVFLRTFLQFAEMDRSVYIECPYRPRSMEDVAEIWCWDILNPEETLPSIQTMFSCPIRRVPFFWSSTVTDYFSKEKRGTYDKENQVITIHIAEKNTNESSCVIPLVAVRQSTRASLKKVLTHAVYHVHNTDPIKDNRFFKENVLKNIEVDTLPLSFHPKQPFYEWVHVPNQVFFSHSRFTSLRPSLLSLIWMGIPLFHNSPILRDLHPTLKSRYYTSNEIVEWIDLMKSFEEDPSVGWNPVSQEEQRSIIYERFGIQTHLDAWKAIVESFSSIPSDLSHKKVWTVAFCDMWEGFPYNENTLMDILRRHAPTSSIEVKGVDYRAVTNPEKEIDLVAVGLFGNDVAKIPASLPKIHLSGENWKITEDPTIRLYLSCSPKEDERHLRFPTWMWFIDWYTKRESLPPSSSRDNPIRIPLSFATRPHSIPYLQRPAFCGFVVSNPTCEFRNQVFHTVNTYKKVNSGGSLYNNIGGPLSRLYPGGGAGDISKHQFFTKHRFTLSFENSQADGYVTEKLLHAKMAGCIPIYWGDSNVCRDFVKGSFLDVSDQSDPKEILEKIKQLENDMKECQHMASMPLLNEEKTQQALHQLKRIGTAIWSFLQPSLPSLPSLPSPASLVSSVRILSHRLSQTWVINLPTRPDRWENLKKAEPRLFSECDPQRMDAVNGKELRMSDMIYKLFEKNSFGWKKSVIGCAMSHLELWKRVACSKDDGYHLILEDDVRFHSEMWDQLPMYLESAPADADLLYLGGVLPPNRPMLSTVLQPISSHWSVIQPNTLFTSSPQRIFHLCAYSYLLNRRGAMKLLRFLIESDKRFQQPADHFLMNPFAGVNYYVATSLPAFCFQDTDPRYIQSNFNDLHRMDVFDSDICNNNECFTPSDFPLSSLPLAPSSSSLSKKPIEREMIVYRIMNTETDLNDLYERSWLEDMFQAKITCRSLSTILETNVPHHAWYMIQRPHSELWNKWFSLLEQRGIPFHILHLSDEFLTDTIQCYSLSNCKWVVRNYHRQETESMSHVITIPLGYHHKPQDSIRPFSERKWIWSFHGTDWFQRREQLEPFSIIHPNECRLQPNWNHPSGSSSSEYLDALVESRFCPILRGNHVETFRLYEALEAGTLPVTTITDKDYLDDIDRELDFSSLYEWNCPKKIMMVMGVEKGDFIQKELQARWLAWKNRIRSKLDQIFTVDPSS